ncbi:hypothetical protein [Gillisia hiemivivida]|uniref:SGNH/GDSL hydrolase family protein n=1 Tax=Gillisia hiemivivida TaxID=291190 RepID=A0A5C6ZR60_9FLAO|nr:hypothetical protein [Gillisia hiemivivida]TXD92848.1 hypothetical protein ES724_12230 [Gillisia hiemivivida]
MNKELTKFIKLIITTIPFIIVSYLLLIILWGVISPSFMNDNLAVPSYGFLKTRLKEAKTTSNVNIVFLGSSRAYRHYDTRIFEVNGYKTFNLGSSAQTFLQTEILSKRNLKRLNPDFIILDIYPEMFSSDGVESSIDLIANDNNDWDTFNLNLKHLNAKVFNSYIYSLFQQNFTASLHKKEPLQRGSSKYVKGGYVERKSGGTSEPSNDTILFDLKNNNQIEAFLRTVNYIRNQGIELILVQSPRHSQLEYTQESKMDSLIKKNDLEYINLSDFNSLNDTIDFTDPLHLNQKGVKIFNSYLIRTVLKDKI